MKFIIFDIDGTLTNTTEVDDKCYMQSFESMFNVSIRNVKWNELINVTDWGITEELIEKKLARTSSAEDLRKLKTLFLKNLVDEYDSNKSQFQEIKGASAFFKSLRDNKDFKLGIGTGGWEETANFKLNVIGINPNEFSYANSNNFKTRQAVSYTHLTLPTICSV